MAAEQEHVEAVLRTLNEAGAVAYERDDLPRVLPPVYSEIEVTRRVGGNARSSGEVDTLRLYEITERSTSKHAASLRAHRDLVSEALENEPLLIGDEISTPVMFGGADPISPDDGRYVAFRTWTYVL